jgi:hypothetical protein
LKIFAICHRCQRHRWCTLSCEYLREFLKKFETALLVYSGAWGKLIHEKKKQKSKISWHCPFNADKAHWHSGTTFYNFFEGESPRISKLVLCIRFVSINAKCGISSLRSKLDTYICNVYILASLQVFYKALWGAKFFTCCDETDQSAYFI